jgi:hypothetical protein
MQQALEAIFLDGTYTMGIHPFAEGTINLSEASYIAYRLLCRNLILPIKHKNPYKSVF